MGVFFCENVMLRKEEAKKEKDRVGRPAQNKKRGCPRGRTRSLQDLASAAGPPAPLQASSRRRRYSFGGDDDCRRSPEGEIRPSSHRRPAISDTDDWPLFRL